MYCSEACRQKAWRARQLREGEFTAKVTIRRQPLPLPDPAILEAARALFRVQTGHTSNPWRALLPITPPITVVTDEGTRTGVDG